MESCRLHRAELEIRCRICGSKRDEGRSHRCVRGLEFQILSVFGVDTRQDDPSRHPEKLCSSCWKFVERCVSADPSCRLPTTNIVPVSEWPECVGDSCVLCVKWKEQKRGGRPPRKKATSARGYPKGSTSKARNSGPLENLKLETVQVNIPKDPGLLLRMESFIYEVPLAPERFVDVGEEWICPVCKDVLDRPVAVPVPGCEHACCTGCWEQWLAVKSYCQFAMRKILYIVSNPFQELCSSSSAVCKFTAIT